MTSHLLAFIGRKTLDISKMNHSNHIIFFTIYVLTSYIANTEKYQGSYD